MAYVTPELTLIGSATDVVQVPKNSPSGNADFAAGCGSGAATCPTSLASSTEW